MFLAKGIKRDSEEERELRRKASYTKINGNYLSHDWLHENRSCSRVRIYHNFRNPGQLDLWDAEKNPYYIPFSKLDNYNPLKGLSFYCAGQIASATDPGSGPLTITERGSKSVLLLPVTYGITHQEWGIFGLPKRVYNMIPWDEIDPEFIQIIDSTHAVPKFPAPIYEASEFRFVTQVAPVQLNLFDMGIEHRRPVFQPNFVPTVYDKIRDGQLYVTRVSIDPALGGIMEYDKKVLRGEKFSSTRIPRGRLKSRVISVNQEGWEFIGTQQDTSVFINAIRQIGPSFTYWGDRKVHNGPSPKTGLRREQKRELLRGLNSRI